MKIFAKKKVDGRKIIYFFDKKFLSWKDKNAVVQNDMFTQIYKKRFSGLTLPEQRFILEKQFKKIAGYDLNLGNPGTFNEKIQWLKLYYHNPLMTICADKVAVRDYVKEKIGEEYLVPSIGIYDKVEDINWEKLPDRFVVKVNWGSGQNIICTDKSNLDVDDAKSKLTEWMKPESNHYYNYLEWGYKNIKPKIIIEKYIEQMDGNLLDWKFFCFGGKAHYVQVDIDRSCNHTRCFYDMNYQKQEFTTCYPFYKGEVQKPANFEKMRELSEILSKDFPHVRVDWYELDGKIYLGEMTFTHGNGTERFTPFKYDKIMGDLLELPIFPVHDEHKKQREVALVRREIYSYPQNAPFRPSVSYPEYPFDEISAQENNVYDMVREGLHLMGLDDENYGTKNWNPLKELIVPGNTVLIKPNLVLHRNGGGEGEDCLFTQPSVVAPMIDYAIKALQGTGKIIVGDAPLQECVFEELISNSGYDKLIAFYKDKGVDIELLDFRNVATYVKGGVHYSQRAQGADNGVVVALDDLSSFAGLNEERIKNMRITNYDPRILQKHHNTKTHEYNVAKQILEADVVINMPKPKSHRKAGLTSALKNMVGMNANKEFLPHHSNTSLKEGGDAYLHASPVLAKANKMLDKGNMLNAEGKYKAAKACFKKFWKLKAKGAENVQEKFWEGSWWGNDTIWRTIFDLNRILLYADKTGQIRNTKQRKYFIVGDMIVSGQNEGPLEPSPKNVGVIAMGKDAVCFDIAIAAICGFDWHKLPSVREPYERLGGVCEITCGQPPVVKSNKPEWNNNSVDDIFCNHSFNFYPVSGWKDVL